MYAKQRAPRDADWPNLIPDNFWGFATMLIDVERLFSEFELSELPTQYGFALRGRHGLGEKGDIFWGDSSVFNDPDYTSEITLPGGSWIMAIKSQESPYVARIALIVSIGSVIALFGIYGLYSRNKKLEAEAEAKAHGRFLAAMSHEIRTPMNGIIGVAEVLQNTELSPVQQNHLDKILSSGKLRLRIVNDILDFSKIDAGGLTLENKVFSMKRVTRSALNSVAAQ